MGHDAVLYKIAKEIYLSGKPTGFRSGPVRSGKRGRTYGKQFDRWRKDLVMNSYNLYVSLYDIRKGSPSFTFGNPIVDNASSHAKLIEYYTEAKMTMWRYSPSAQRTTRRSGKPISRITT